MDDDEDRYFFFDGTWGRRKFIAWYESLDNRTFMEMAIEYRNRLHDLYEGYVDSLIAETEFGR